MLIRRASPATFSPREKGGKPFERGREDGMGVDGSASRQIQLRQRERGAELKTVCALLLRDGDGGQEGVFRGRGIGGVAREQNSAARPMQFGRECAEAPAFG